MESNGKFTLIVFNTCTREYEEVMVTEEVYRTYCRPGGTSRTMIRAFLAMRSR